MMYFKCEANTAPEVTGSRNGVYSVEINNKNSFKSKKDLKCWNNYINSIIKNKKLIDYDDFLKFKINELENEILFFPVGKRVKELDFMAFAPRVRTFQAMVSSKTLELIKQCNLQLDYNCLDISIDRFQQKYHLFGVPRFSKDSIDFKKSIYQISEIKKKHVFENQKAYDIYKDKDPFNIKPLELCFKQKNKYDFVYTIHGLYISELVKETFEKNNITGYQLSESISIKFPPAGARCAVSGA